MGHTYSAFISYRHLPADIAAAKAVQRALETYRIPADIRKKTGVKKLNRCFRDQDELPLADDLGSSIEKALQESEWLIVICSPDLPGSKWCLREIDYFIELGRKDHIIPVLISGEPKESYPPQITHVDTEEETREVEPLAADIRGNLNKQLKTEKLRIIARMLNLNYNDLKKREKEQALRRSLALVSCVLAAVLGFAVYALYQNRLLTEERNATARNEIELLIEKSVRATTEREIGSGFVYALQAYDNSRMFDAEYDPAVSAAIEAGMYPDLFSQIGTLKDNGIIHGSARLSNDGMLVTCHQSDFSLPVYSSVTGEKLYSIRDFGRYWESAFSPDSRYVCRCMKGETEVTLYDSRNGEEVLKEALPEEWEISIGKLTANNAVPVTRKADGAEGLYNLFSKELTILEGIQLSGDIYETIAIHRSGSRGAWSDGERIWIVDLENGGILKTVEGSLFDIYSEVTDEGPYLRYLSEKAYIYLRWDTLEEVLRSEHKGALSPDGKLLAAANGTDGFTVYDTATGEEIWSDGFESERTSYYLEFADNDTLIASHNQLQVYRISSREMVYDSGEDRVTYGFDIAAGRLVMPLRTGGCLINLMPEEEDAMPHVTVEARGSYNPEDMVTSRLFCTLMGNWGYSQYYGIDENGKSETVVLDEPGLVYRYEGQEYLIHPINGIAANSVYVSPDGEWQALIREAEVDIFRAKEGPEPVMTIPGNGYDRLKAALYGNVIALSGYVENLTLYDLTTGECIGTLDTGAMCSDIQFSPDGKHIIAFSGMKEHVTVFNMENRALIMQIPVKDARSLYYTLKVGFNADGTEAVVLYPDGHADVGLLTPDLDTLVKKARHYTGTED